MGKLFWTSKHNQMLSKKKKKQLCRKRVITKGHIALKMKYKFFTFAHKPWCNLAQAALPALPLLLPYILFLPHPK